MKNLIVLSFVALLLSGISACNRDACKNVVCPAGRQCLNGSCVCNNGFEGDDCLTQAAPKFLGTYNVSINQCMNNAVPFPNTYTTFISASSRPDMVIINNFLGEGVQLEAYILTNQQNQGRTLQIPEQSFYRVRGTGELIQTGNMKQILFELEYTYQNTLFACRHQFFPF